ncbi:MAG: serine/threonine protein kinase [Bdellovibrionaceae bacterium]|nr:serine/threonine protein kinase [Pseudobdellovibrionaceae bacterium]
MARRKSLQTLNIFLNALPLGSLSYEKRNNLIFTYNAEWLNRQNSFPISRSLPLREEVYEGRRVYAYFDNLLPDGISIRQRIAAQMHAKSDQAFDLLEVVGRDCVGALQFVKTTDEEPSLEAPTGTPLTEKEIASKLRKLRTIPLGASDEEDFRLSIAGAQEKTAFLLLNGKWHTPLGASPTTHIFKPQIGEIRPGLGFADSVENEWLCAKIVKAFGVPVAECEIEFFEDIKVLVVERFDRAWVGNKLIRLPQEDICQALSIPNFKKYENEGGPGIVQIMDLMNESINRDEDRYNFMKTQIIFLLLGAIDGHAKNFSLSWRPTGFEMTPLYDILSAQPLLDKGVFQLQKLKMPMAYGNSRKYRLNEIYRRNVLETAKLCRFDQDRMEEIIDQTINEIPEVIERVQTSLPQSFPKEIAESILTGMTKRQNQFIKSSSE